MDLSAKIKAMLDALTADDPEAIKAAASDLLAALAGAESSEPPAPAADTLAADPEPPPAKLAALTALRSVTGCTSLGEAVAALNVWKAERDANAANVLVLEESSRFGLVTELVKLGVELPGLAWTGEGKDRKLAKRLTDEPIAELRARVVALRAAGPRTAAPLAPPASEPLPTSDGRVVVLSATELQAAEKIKDPAKKADFIARRVARAKG